MLANRRHATVSLVVAVAGATVVTLVALQASPATLVPAAFALVAGTNVHVRLLHERRRSAEVIARQAEDLRAARAASEEIRRAASLDRGAAVAAEIARELRTPLTVLLASTRALSHPGAGLSGRQADLAESAARNATRIARVVDVMLLDEESEQPVRGIVDVRAAIEDAAGGSDPRDVGANVDDALFGVGDEARLRGALERLIADAGRDGRRVDVRARSVEGRIEIEIAASSPPLDAPDWFGVFVARRLLDGTGAQISLDVESGRAVLSLPSLGAAAMQARARWSAG